jgi:hypothetical protein
VTGRRERTRGTAEDPARAQLVGRADALRLVDKTLDRAGKGTFQLLELVGEPGVGKSRLLAEAVSAARSRAMLPLLGRASEFERDAPLAAIADALDDHLETLPERQLARLSANDRRLLGSVFAGIAADAPAEAPDRYRLFRAVRACWSCWPRPAAWCWSSTTCTGPTRALWSCWTTCCGTRREAGSWWPWPTARVRHRRS